MEQVEAGASRARTSNTTTSGPLTSRLLSLPQELQDLIFDFAYCPSDTELTLIDTRKVVQKLRSGDEGDTGDAKTPNPSHKVNEFLVCKQFFVNAAQAYIRNLGVLKDDGLSDAMLRNHGIIPAFMTGWKGDATAFEDMPYLPCIQQVVLGLYPQDFAAGWQRDPSKTEYEDTDFVAIPGIAKLLTMPTVRKIEVRHFSGFGFKMEEQATLFNKNISGLEAFVLKSTDSFRHNLTSTKKSGSELYPGSRVALNGSELLPVEDIECHLSHFCDGENGSEVSEDVDSEGDGENEDEADEDDDGGAKKPARKRRRTQKHLTDGDIPEDAEDLQSLLNSEKGTAVVEWIQRAKAAKQLLQPLL